MPIYEYRCCNCGEVFERLILGLGEGVQCPRCGHTEVEKLLSPCTIKGVCELASP